MEAEAAAREIARLVHDGFDTFYGEFKRLTRQARYWFDGSDWIRIHQESHRRIDLYQRFVSRTLASLSHWTEQFPQSIEVWRAAHIEFDRIAGPRVDVEVARTFFNAITRKIFNTVGVNREVEFLDADYDPDPSHSLPGLVRRFDRRDDLAALFVEILQYPRPAISWADVAGEADYLAGQLLEAVPEFDYIEALKVVFFRVREAYVVCRVVKGTTVLPLLIPIQVTARGVLVDGAIFTESDTLEVFSSTRSYMFVDVERPVDLVNFLRPLMPRLTLSELYIGIAHHRHGKTLIYRELVDHLERSDDQFIVAPGIKGLVMTVFTMPSYRNVFKMIRDRFDKPAATREAILRSYRDVFRGRRVGRLADTQEFEYLEFDRARFTDECMAELLDKASHSVDVLADKVVVKHVYIEEKMVPLNLYMARASVEDAQAAIVDYGYAIKELAENNIFAGDLLWKNFGVTGSGRLVLYDYDEICPLADCTFRDIPPPRSWEEEMSARPFYAVADTDVFPEEWAPFIVPRQHPSLTAAFLDAHSDLMTAEFWREKQKEVLAGAIYIGLPYQPRYPELQTVAVRGPRPAN